VRTGRVCSRSGRATEGRCMTTLTLRAAADGLGSTNVGNYVGRRQFNLARGRPRKGVVGLKFA